ncbi:AcrR family transcriptional regulator [Ereboglobus sp. PH5-5]|nr:AcrR family transcriptional regulator [Ereboglobus sp. PH5-10]MDF9833503.1 AcrR family transcriptional regulator [Ereboglobus sp. PH5-5]
MRRKKQPLDTKTKNCNVRFKQPFQMTDRNKNHAAEAERDTKSRILDVAERMIAGRGVQQVSIREITQEAGVNLAAINYHFGSKERLIAEVLAHRITALNDERMALLKEVEAAAGDRAPTVEAILEAAIRPLLHTDQDERNKYAHTAKMISRFFLDPDDEITSFLTPFILPFKDRILKMLARALPDMNKDELEWRTVQVFAILHHHMLFADLRCHKLGKNLSVKKELRRLLTFCSAGMRASLDGACAH